MSVHPPLPSAPRSVRSLRRSRRQRTIAALAVAVTLAGCSQPDETALDDTALDDTALDGSALDDTGGAELGEAGSDRPGPGRPGSGAETTSGAADASEADGGGSEALPDFGDPGDLEGYEPVAEEDVEPIGDVDHEAVDLVAAAPEQIIAEVAVQIDDAGVGGGGEVLDAVGPIDEAAPPADVSEAGRRNEGGELVRLDEPAELACGQAEIAIGRLDDARVEAASELLATAAASAGASGVADIRSWSTPLAGAAEAGTGEASALVGFLTVCAEGGYEL